MRCRRTMALAALALLAPAAAQSFTSDSSITFSLRWAEQAGNSNGVLEPGEAALITLDVLFTNQNGIANFTPHIGTFGSGTIRGFGSGFLDLHGTSVGGDARGAWNVDTNQGYGVNPDWDIVARGGNGSPANGGADLENLQFGQFSSTPLNINTTNPVLSIWTGLWTPASYQPRTVNWTPAGAAAAGLSAATLELRLSNTGTTHVVVVRSNLFYTSTSIPIIPAPWSCAALVFTLTIPLRRRSRAAR